MNTKGSYMDTSNSRLLVPKYQSPTEGAKSLGKLERQSTGGAWDVLLCQKIRNHFADLPTNDEDASKRHRGQPVSGSSKTI